MVGKIKMSGILFATPSFLGGMAKCIDIGSTLTVYNESTNEELADENALLSDWVAVGDDINYSINAFKEIQIDYAE